MWDLATIKKINTDAEIRKRAALARRLNRAKKAAEKEARRKKRNPKQG